MVIESITVPAQNSCWSCAANDAANALFCTSCHSVQPASNEDYFALLKVPAQFAVDAALLEKNYLHLQSQLHPDRFAQKNDREKLLAQSQAVSINEAYHTLRDPIRRGSYWLRRNGVDFDIAAERTIHDQVILLEMLERREELADATDNDTIQKMITAVRDEFAAAVAALADDLAACQWDLAKKQLLRLQYLQKFLLDARGRQQAMLMSADNV
jgi:molecular chaperone HscB